MSKWRLVFVVFALVLLAGCVNGITSVGGCPITVADSLRGGSAVSDSTFTVGFNCRNGFR